MKNLIKFELRKILTKRFAVISIAAILLLSLILSFSTLHSMYAFDGNGTEEQPHAVPNPAGNGLPGNGQRNR